MVSLERTFSLHVPASTENLAMIREFVTSIGEQAGQASTEIAKLVMAVDEACANVIEHAYGNDMTKEVSVRATLDEAVLEIIVTDTGIGFDPNSVEQKGLDKLIGARKSGGLGMRLIRNFMDEVHYQITGEKNELRMVKKLKKH
jgi:anti-sigma regulatory factor (Ser/Thr protein kinase)